MALRVRRDDVQGALRSLGVAIAAALVVLAVVVKAGAQSSRIEHAQYDLLYRRVPRTVPVDPRLALFEIHDATLDLYGFPIPRERHAALTRGLSAVKAKALVWDVIFRGDRAADADLEAAMREIPTILAIGVRDAGLATTRVVVPGELETQKFRVGLASDWPEAPVVEPAVIQSRPAFLLAAAGGGHALAALDEDGVVRRVPPVVSLEGKMFAALGLRAALETLGVPPTDVDIADGELVVGASTLPEPVRVPLDAGGNVLIDFPPAYRDVLDVRRYETQLESLADPDTREAVAEDLAGRTVFVGDAASAASDYVAVAWGENRGLVPAVTVWVALANAILTGSFVRPAPAALWPAMLFGAPLLVALAWWKLRPLVAALVTAGLLAALPLASLALFAGARTFVPVAGPFAATALAGGMLMVLSLTREQARAVRIADVLSRFVSPALLKELEDAAKRDAMPPARRAELSVLFIDVAGFTPFTEGQEPEALSAFLDRFYEMAMEELFKQGGMLEKFMGDGVLAYFGAPDPLPDKERRAVAAAVAIRDRFAAYDAERVARGGPPLAIRCGITTGWVAVGYFGGKSRGTYGVIGRSVNLASRIQGYAEPGGILVDRATAARLDGAVSTKALEPIQLKGIAKPVEVFAVVGAAEAAARQGTAT